MSSVNIFIAYILPADKREALDKVSEEIREVFVPEGKDEQFYHTTLLFIGNVDKRWLPFIKEKIAEIASSQTSITININRLGYFFNEKKQRIKVLYVVPSEIPEALSNLCTQLFQVIGLRLAGKTVPPIAPARIHLTITKRLKHVLSQTDFLALSQKIKPFNIPVTIDNIALYHCKDETHRHYREICKYNFVKSNDA